MTEAPLRNARQEAWRQRNPKAVWAQAALRSGLRRGLLATGPCAVCGEMQAEAHHPAYERPLAVEWLCRRHHKAAHGKGEAQA